MNLQFQTELSNSGLGELARRLHLAICCANAQALAAESQDLAEKIEQLNAAIDEVSAKIGQDQPVEDAAPA